MGRCRCSCTAVALILFTLATATRADSGGTVLRVGTSGDYQPFSRRDASGAFTGFDIAVARRLGVDLGRPVEFVPLQWPDLVAQLRAGSFDIAMSGVTVRADRAVQIAFSRPYVITGAVAVIRAGDGKRFHDVTDLNREGVRIAVNRGGHLEQVARQHFPDATLTTVNDNAALPDLLLHGHADVVISEELEAHTWPAERIAILGPFTRDRKAYALRRDATDLLRQLNDWLAAREADGWLNDQRRRWLGERAVVTPQQAGLEALVTAIDLRLQLMPLVAAVKRRDQLPIEDPAQETRVLDHVRSAAMQAGLNADDVAELFRLQMEAAKAIERSGAAEPAPADLQLADLRSAVTTASDQIIRELARCRSWLIDPSLHDQLDGALHGLSAPGLPPATVSELVAALHHVRTSVGP